MLIITGKIKQVVDGDSVIVAGNDGNDHDIRLHNVRTPEIGENGYTGAKQYLEKLLPSGTPVTIAVEVDGINQPVKTAGTSRIVKFVKSGKYVYRKVGLLFKGTTINEQMRQAQNLGTIKKGGY